MPDDDPKPYDWRPLTESPFWPGLSGVLEEALTQTHRKMEMVDTLENLRFLQGQAMVYRGLLRAPEAQREELRRQAQQEREEAELEEENARRRERRPTY